MRRMAARGRFWQGRYQSQALLDEAGLLTAMAYVDLNPIRAGMASTPEESEFTSIYARIQAMKRAEAPASESTSAVEVKVPLLIFREEASEPAIPFSLREYLELVDWSGRAIRSDKRGAIEGQLPGILQRMNIDPKIGRA